MAKSVKDAYGEILRLRNEFYRKWQDAPQYDENRVTYKAKYEAFDKALELLTPSIVDPQPQDPDELAHSVTRTSDQDDTENESLEEAYQKYADHQIERIYPGLSPNLPRPSRMTLKIFDGTDIELAFERGSQWKEMKTKDNAIRLLDEAYNHGRHDMRHDMMKNLPTWKNGTPPQKGWWLTRTEHKENLISIACVPFRDDGWPYRDESNVLYMDMNDLKDLPRED